MKTTLHKSVAICLAWIATSIAIQPGAAPAQIAPLRDLEFGDINFLHTTDTHGWHAGHLLEPSFSADWGDYISFAEHLRAKLDEEGKDLIVVDTGDRIEGNGLYDASNPRGKYTFDIFKQAPIDLLCSGNHELYKNSSAEDDYLNLVPAYKHSYLASNLQIIDPHTSELEPLAPTHRTFRTKHTNLTITAMGFIFDFTRNDKNTLVTPVEDSIKQSWFQTLIHDPSTDLFIIIGHIALRQLEMDLIYNEIRKAAPNTPIHFFGGHFHIRDYRIFDSKAHALASGRFMETIGFSSMSFTNLSNTKSSNITYTRRYIDNNLFSLHHHSGTNATTFPTQLGLNTTAMITEARTALNLDQTFGCAPQDYWMSRVPYPHKDSIFNLLTNQIFPDITNPARSNKTRMILTNTGAIRFDIFKGAFTRDSTFIVSPFTSNLSYIPDVPTRLAHKLLPILNGLTPPTSLSSSHDPLHDLGLDLDALAPPEQRARVHLEQHTNPSALQQSIIDQQVLLKSGEKVMPGYTTHDDLGTDGDDTIHSPIQFYNVPNCVQAVFPASSPSLEEEEQQQAVVDLIFNQFLTPYVVRLLNLLPYSEGRSDGASTPFWSEDDVENYVPGETFTSLLARWIGENWKENCDDEERERIIEKIEL